MTKRVKQHQMEDLSRSKFSLAIPRNWVYRDKDKDYGIDAEVELFDDNDRATGLVYWVQLKATKSNDETAVKKIDLSIESIKYYKSLDIPVLIRIINRDTSHIFVMNEYIDTLNVFQEKNNQHQS
ncbi:MAG: DUF4365 domain-containing protein [Candidatus Roizmanbacteria bacterium]|nr:DUF4365 domain-containing protein [Candidatus Roizmanbacteria bacterium]